MVQLKPAKYSIYQLVLPVSKKQVEFRPWNMAEHKILLMAYSGEERKEVRRAIRQVVEACVVGGVDVLNLPMADLEFLFTRIRSRSVGETAEITLENSIKNESKKILLDISKLEVTLDPERSTQIDLVDTDGKPTGLFFIMKEPTVGIFEEVIALKAANPQISEDIEIAVRCVDKVCDATNQDSSEEKQKEIRDFIETMTPKQYASIGQFLDTILVLRYEVDLSTVFEGMTGKYVLEGLDSFFE